MSTAGRRDQCWHTRQGLEPCDRYARLQRDCVVWEKAANDTLPRLERAEDARDKYRRVIDDALAVPKRTFGERNIAASQMQKILREGIRNAG